MDVEADQVMQAVVTLLIEADSEDAVADFEAIGALLDGADCRAVALAACVMVAAQVGASAETLETTPEHLWSDLLIEEARTAD